MEDYQDKMAENNEMIVRERIPEPIPVAWQQGKALDASLVEMYDRCLWTDVKFRCKDHEEEGLIQAHRIVLSARSPVFQAMFFGPCADGKDEVNIDTVNSATLRLFLRYLYCDKVTLTEETAFTVLEMAHCYQVSVLVQYCADYLATVIASSNVCRILSFSMLYELTNLKTDCCSFIDNHAEEVLKSDEFMNLSAECVLYILKGDTFHADEAVILDAAEKWSRRKVIESGLEETGANIRTCLGESFYQLRLPTMTYKSLMKCTSRKGYLSIEEYADIAGFINKTPDITISTNSCVPRVPERDSIIVDAENRCQLIDSSVCSELEIYVTKDVALSGIVLCEMKPYLKYNKGTYTDVNCYTKEEVRKIDLTDYAEKVIKVKKEIPNYYGYRITVLESLDGVDLPENLGLVLSGSITVNKVDFRHNFTLQQRQTENGKVCFNPPLILKKEASPYHVEMKVKYDNGHGIQIKTRSAQSMYGPNERISGHIKVRSLSGSTTGVKSIEFLNFPNRDICEEMTFETTLESTK